MPRIRTLKPEALQHRKVGALSDRQFRLWVAMLSQSDDTGRLNADSFWLKTVAFGYHPTVRTRDVDAAKRHLAEVGLICLYEVNGQHYAHFPSWDDHQKINRPSPSKLPAPACRSHKNSVRAQ